MSEGLFELTTGRMQTGFHIRFNNGVTVSVQWGPGVWADNHTSISQGYLSNHLSVDFRSTTAEVAVIFPNDEFVYASDFLDCYNDDEDDYSDICLGYCTPEDVAEILNNASSLTEEGMNRIMGLKKKREEFIKNYEREMMGE